MILLDTNVVSEPLKRRPNAEVLSWLDRQAPGSLCLSSTGLAELLYGIEILPDGQRRKTLAADLESLLAKQFADRIFDFDRDAAFVFAKAAARARARGDAVDIADGQIAAIAVARGLYVATRDTAPFLAMGAKVINPWTSA